MLNRFELLPVKLAVLVAGILLVVLAAACGSEAAPSATPPPPPTQAPTIAVPPTADPEVEGHQPTLPPATIAETDGQAESQDAVYTPVRDGEEAECDPGHHRPGNRTAAGGVPAYHPDRIGQGLQRGLHARVRCKQRRRRGHHNPVQRMALRHPRHLRRRGGL